MAVITTIRSAFGFLTRLPVGPWPLQNDLNGISAWLPLVGLVVGGLAGGLTWAATLLFPSLVCGVIGCACWVAITGGLHLDGVADCGDGLPVEVPRERRLEIMKDSRLGTFGGTALFFNLAFKAASAASAAEPSVASSHWKPSCSKCSRISSRMRGSSSTIKIFAITNTSFSAADGFFVFLIVAYYSAEMSNL